MKRLVLLVCFWGMVFSSFSTEFLTLYKHYRDKHSQNLSDLVMSAIVRHDGPHNCDNMYALILAYYGSDRLESDAEQAVSDYIYSLMNADSSFFVKIDDRLKKLEIEEQNQIRERLKNSLISANEVERYNDIMYWDIPDSVKTYTERFVNDYPDCKILFLKQK